MIHTGSARWVGNVKQGSGTVSSETGVLKDDRVTFNSRLEGAPGSNPEELIGAAHAACFSMYYAGLLDKAGHQPDEIKTTAKVKAELVNGRLSIPRIELDTRVRVSDLDDAKVKELAQQAKNDCPVSRLYKGAEITVSVSRA